MENAHQGGFVFVRVRDVRARSFSYKRQPAVRIPAANGSVLLRPKPEDGPARPIAFKTITLVEGVTVQLAMEQERSQTPAARNPGSSAQGSHAFVGLGKHAAVGKRFDRHVGY